MPHPCHTSTPSCNTAVCNGAGPLDLGAGPLDLGGDSGDETKEDVFEIIPPFHEEEGEGGGGGGGGGSDGSDGEGDEGWSQVAERIDPDGLLKGWASIGVCVSAGYNCPYLTLVLLVA